MKLLTLNAWHKSGPWKDRWEIIFRGLDKLQPDVTAFQELFDPDWAREVVKRSSYPYPVWRHASSGLVILSRLPVGRNDIYTMKCQSPFEDYSRHVLWTEVTWGSRGISIFNTHFSWKIEDGATRKAQVREAWEWIQRKACGEVILMGDMNAPPHSEEIAWLLKEGGFVDAFGSLHPKEPGYSWDNRNSFARSHRPPLPNRRIDFILVRGEELAENLSSCRLVFNEPDERGLFASDHFGVIAEIAEPKG